MNAPIARREKGRRGVGGSRGGTGSGSESTRGTGGRRSAGNRSGPGSRFHKTEGPKPGPGSRFHKIGGPKIGREPRVLKVGVDAGNRGRGPGVPLGRRPGVEDRPGAGDRRSAGNRESKPGVPLGRGPGVEDRPGGTRGLTTPGSEPRVGRGRRGFPQRQEPGPIRKPGAGFLKVRVLTTRGSEPKTGEGPGSSSRDSSRGGSLRDRRPISDRSSRSCRPNSPRIRRPTPARKADRTSPACRRPVGSCTAKSFFPCPWSGTSGRKAVRRPQTQAPQTYGCTLCNDIHKSACCPSPFGPSSRASTFSKR